MIIEGEPPAETALRATRLVVRCGTVEITSDGMGVGTLTVDGVPLEHSEITFTSKIGAVDELIIRTSPRRFVGTDRMGLTSEVLVGTRASHVVKHDPPAAIPTIVEEGTR